MVKRSYPNAIRAILFDLDGVLWDSSAAHELAFQKAFQEAGISEFTSYSTIAGMRTEEAVAAHLESQGIKARDEQIIHISNAKRYFASILLAEKVQLSSGLVQVLQSLSLGHRLALCSSASYKTIEIFFNKSRTRAFFSAIVSGQDVHHAKPAPDIFLRAADLLEVSPTNSLVVEDSISGIFAGISAGMRVLGIGEEAKKLKHSNKLVGILPNIIDIPSWIEGYMKT